MKVLVGRSSRACSELCKSSFLAVLGSSELQGLWDAIQDAKKRLGSAINYDMLRFCASAIIAFGHDTNGFENVLSLQDDYNLITASERDSIVGVCKALRQLLPKSEVPLERIVHQMIGRSKCNCFGIWEQQQCQSFPESEMFGYALYTRSSFFNHSCRPNISKLRVGREMRFTTIVDIAAGEELLISYLGDREHRTFDDRRLALKEWGFVCVCALCAGQTRASPEI